MNIYSLEFSFVTDTFANDNGFSSLNKIKESSPFPDLISFDQNREDIGFKKIFDTQLKKPCYSIVLPVSFYIHNNYSCDLNTNNFCIICEDNRDIKIPIRGISISGCDEQYEQNQETYTISLNESGILRVRFYIEYPDAIWGKTFLLDITKNLGA